MDLKNKIFLLKETRQSLKYKLLNEGLTKKENQILSEIDSLIKEDEMTFGSEVGGARPSRTLQSKIERGELPLNKFGLTQPQVDFFTSEAFKFSIQRLEELIGRDSDIARRLNISNPNFKSDSVTAFRTLMTIVQKLMGELTRLQMGNKEEIEQIAMESVEKAMGIDNEFFTKMIKLDGELSYGFLPKLSSMKAKADKISDEEILDKFADIDAEKTQKLEDLKNDFESMGIEFNEEKAKEAIQSTFKISPETLEKAKEEFSDAVTNRMIINYFRRGMALYYADAYKICMRKIQELPGGERILEISNVIQPIMLHMYWLFDDIGGIGTSGGGQIGQVEVLSPEETGETGGDMGGDYEEEEELDFGGAFTVRARASTLPLLVHELVKGTIMFFTSAAGGGTTSDEQRALAKRAATSLEIEAYDLVFSEVFFKRFYEIFNEIVPNEDEQRELIPGVLKYFSEVEDEDIANKGKLKKLVQSLTIGKDLDPYAESFVEEIIEKAREMTTNLKKDFPSYSKKKYDIQKPEQEDDDEDDLSWLDED
jgi:hypothetical protein